MSSPIARITDTITTGHDCDSTSDIKEGSSNVFANGLGVVRIGDSDTHEIRQGLVCVNHTVVVGSASSTVFANGRGVARLGDTFSGEPITTGSPNVFAG